jgi:DnaJ-domain-containing protein 1
VTTGEFLAIVVGLLVGSVAVWLLISKIQKHSVSPTLDAEGFQDNDESWSEVLGVSPEASSEEIRSAYENKLAELVERSPRILTQQELAIRKHSTDRLEAAYRSATQ